MNSPHTYVTRVNAEQKKHEQNTCQTVIRGYLPITPSHVAMKINDVVVNLYGEFFKNSALFPSLSYFLSLSLPRVQARTDENKVHHGISETLSNCTFSFWFMCMSTVKMQLVLYY